MAEKASEIPLNADVPAMEVSGLTVKFPVRGGVLGKVQRYFTAVDDVSFTLPQGKILSVVGESGCGKSTLVKSLVGLVPMASGTFKLFGETVCRGKVAGPAALQKLEGLATRKLDGLASQKLGGLASQKPCRVSDLVQMIFQDPFSSLNPRQTVAEILTAPLLARGVKFDVAETRAKELLERVSLPAASLQKFPHEFSGGQRQRLCIARSLMVRPRILLCDEVTSALDVSVQAQILHLLDDLRNEFGLSILFISHDMQVVRALSDEVLVMYFGHVVERGHADEVLTNPQHEYTQKLLASVPTIRRKICQ
ncbi:ATP-binding cassette domain-containing protein [Fibrobacter sp.]|uniref:ATP-binding cassette domain-containing protein n=1 Tax=Fibrobacter sp. TaxID=35828 RepID=UPI0025BC4228|nr:ATP-binding cassette domain-containing protein [Fibrobacter sp.]MBS7273154.1 ABC transporter ATP-binding protein [Fibrobacter sp.]MDD7497095.1 ATP-binding cassette domain-containing protein [Fibrobacter sp.]MDY5725737.1 ATP-binding cassette domain-containing protein [Fibrobacter sp.]